MVLTVITLILILVGVFAYFFGAIKLSKYGFRLGTGIGLAVIFFPPYTFYFALKKLEVDGKEFPTAMCSFGIIVTTLMILVFSHPLGLLVTGQIDELNEFMLVEKAPEGVVLLDDETVEDLKSDDPDRAAAAEAAIEEARQQELGLPDGVEEDSEDAENTEENEDTESEDEDTDSEDEASEEEESGEEE